MIRETARSYIREHFLNGDSELLNFYKEVRNFYKYACDYIQKKKMPLGSELLKYAEFADISLRKDVTFSSIHYFMQIFKNMCVNINVYKTEEQFAFYQIIDFRSLNFPRMDSTWSFILNITGESSTKKFNSLAKLPLLVLLIPHSNAYAERVSSIV